MLLYLALCAAILQISHCVSLTGEDRDILESATSVTITCNVESNVDIDENKLKWVTGSGGSEETLTIADDSVTYDSGAKKTTFTLDPAPSSTTIYKCEYDDNDTDGEVTNGQVTVTVLDFTVNPGSIHILKDSVGVLTCTITTTSYTNTISWYKDDVFVTGGVSQSSTHQVSTAGLYKCTAVFTASGTFLGGTVTSQVATISILEFTSVSSAVTILKGQDTSLACTIPSTSYSVTVEWYKDGTKISEDLTDHKNAEYTAAYTATEGGVYLCKATYTAEGQFSGGELNSDTVTVTEIDFTINPISTNVGKGKSLSLTCKIGISEFSGTFSWFKGAAEIGGTSQAIKANQENEITYPVEGAEENAGTYFCRAVYDEQTGLGAGSFDSAVATITVPTVTVNDIVVEKDGDIVLKCVVNGASQDLSVMKFIIKDGADITEEESLTTFTEGLKTMTASISAVDADRTYQCVVGWDLNMYNYDLFVDVIEVGWTPEVAGVTTQSTTLTCTVTDSQTTPTSVFWKTDSENIMSEDESYLPSKDTSDTTITSTLKIKSVSSAEDYTCVFQYLGNQFEFTKTTQLQVIDIEVRRGGALQDVPTGVSKVSCMLKQSDQAPSEYWWEYNGNKITANVATSTYSNGSISTELSYTGVDHDSSFFCMWRFGEVTVHQAVPVEVGEMTVSGDVVGVGEVSRITCSIKDFGNMPDEILWKKGGDVIQTLQIDEASSTTSWSYLVSNAASSTDAGSYSCGLRVGNDLLEKSNDVMVGAPVTTVPGLTAQGSQLTLTCTITMYNKQADPTAYWKRENINFTDPTTTLVTDSVATATVVLDDVRSADEKEYVCIFVFDKPEFNEIESTVVTPQILAFTTEPMTQYGRIGDTASFTCVGESGVVSAGTPSTKWYTTEGVEIGTSTTYSLEIQTEQGYEVVCKITWSATDVVLEKRMAAVLSSVSALSNKYTTVDKTSFTITCTYQATSEFGDAPSKIIWYRTSATDSNPVDMSGQDGYEFSQGAYTDRTQIATLKYTKTTPLSYDNDVYQCHFSVGDQNLMGQTTLRVLGIHFLSISEKSLTKFSGESLKITATTSRTYDIEATWRWFKKGDQTNILASEAEMVFQSLRVANSTTYVVNANFIIPDDDDTLALDVPWEITLSVKPSCKTGTIKNIKNSGDIPEFVDNGWNKKISCLDDFLLDTDPKNYKSEQDYICESADYVELDIADCIRACVFMVDDTDTHVTFRDSVKDVGRYNMYPNDNFAVSCDFDKNLTLPSGSSPTYSCKTDSGGIISYSKCTGGCLYETDDSINLTFPQGMYNGDIIPVGEKVSYECLRGKDTIYNADKTLTCTADLITNKSQITFLICSVPVPWQTIIIGLSIFLLVLALVMIIFSAYLYLRRQKRKIKLLSGGDGIYSNPVAKENDGNDMEMIELCKPIDISLFHTKYKQLMVDDCYALSLEYAKISKDVPTSMFPITVAKQPMYKPKNRFVDILPYDATRVTLQQIGDDPTSHYINASFIDTLEEPRKFIAAQGPKPETLSDFWRMIWEQNSHAIVMVTNFIEKGRQKCEEYWHDTKPMSYGNTTVECLGIVSFPDYKVRKFSVTQGSSKSRIITHYHYEGWPDHGVPDAPTSMISFAKRAFSDNLPGPVVVHCSAGVGRTGTIITLHLQMENLRNNRKINIYDTVVQLRKCRKIMVQTESQYVFLFQGVNELLRCGDTEIYAQMLSHAYRDLRKLIPGTDKTGLQNEYQRLVYIAKEDINDKFVEATKEYNHNKNRYHNILPYEKNRVKLAYQTGVPGSDYINASFISSYHEKNVYISTQAPKEGTIVDFWKMIFETGASSIICMTALVEDGKMKCAQYWPSQEQETTEHGPCKIKLLAIEEGPDVTRRELCLTHSSDNHQNLNLIRMWHFTSLSEKTMKLSGLKMISVIEHMSRWQKQQGNTPAIVHCGGGVGRAAAFIAIANCLEQLKLEGTVDIFQTVLYLRRSRPFMVQSVDQYDYIYKSLVQYVDSFETYQNFK